MRMKLPVADGTRMSLPGRLHAFGSTPESGRTKPNMAPACGLDHPVRSRSAPKSRVRHRPRSRGIAPYFPAYVLKDIVQLGVTKQELHRPQVLGSFVDQCRLGPSHAVRAIGRRIEPDGGNPLVYDPGILASRNMRRFRLTTGEQILLRLQIRFFDPCRNRGSRRLGQVELHRLLGLSLHDHRSGHYLVGVHHISNPQVDEITAT